MKFHKDGTLPTNRELFVFGSNLAGRHGAGAAKIAREKFGAKNGLPLGVMGGSYAIPTKDENLLTLPLEEISLYVERFILFTQLPLTENVEFFVTRVGCGLAGYKDHQIAPMFKGAMNCSFAEEWRPYLGDYNYE